MESPHKNSCQPKKRHLWRVLNSANVTTFFLVFLIGFALGSTKLETIMSFIRATWVFLIIALLALTAIAIFLLFFAKPFVENKIGHQITTYHESFSDFIEVLLTLERVPEDIKRARVKRGRNP